MGKVKEERSMKQMVCEMCGGTDLVKQDGVFVCQTCGIKYSVEEAKKMMVEGTVEVTGTVKIDNSDNYSNLVQLVRESLTDKRFDSAYNQCTEALAINPNDPEMVVVQGLSVLGKEEIVTDVPSSSVNSMKRMLSIMSDYKGTFEEKREIFSRIKEHTDVVVKFKESIYNDQISNLNSQKVQYKSSQESFATVNYALQTLGGTVFSQQKAEADYDKIQAKKEHNAKLDIQIIDIRKKIRKLKDFEKKYLDEINLELDKISKEEGDYKSGRRNAYWEEHKEEKAELDEKLKSLEIQLQPINETLGEKQNEFNNIKKILKEMQVPSNKEREKMQQEVKCLELKMTTLGIFKGKEKAQITEEIARIQARMPSDSDIYREREELKKEKEPELNTLRSDISALQEQADKLIFQINEIKAELNKER
jgi:uncharacterized Zn finger protein (UPF0148 family)/chromosome segregation ATPase